MPIETTEPDMSRPDDLDEARRALVEALQGAGLPQPTDGIHDHITVDGRALSLELRYNGETIALDGRDETVLPGDAFEDFVKRQAHAVEQGDLDDAIRATLKPDGTGKATARVRGVGATGE